MVESLINVDLTSIFFILHQDLNFVIHIIQIDPNKTDSRTVKSL